jgi:hypothetical protein
MDLDVSKKIILGAKMDTMNYSRKDNNAILSFLKDNDEDFDIECKSYIRVLNPDEYGRQQDPNWDDETIIHDEDFDLARNIWKDLCGMDEGGCADMWVVYDDENEGLVLGGVRTSEQNDQFHKWYVNDLSNRCSRIYIVMVEC